MGKRCLLPSSLLVGPLFPPSLLNLTRSKVRRESGEGILRANSQWQWQGWSNGHAICVVTKDPSLAEPRAWFNVLLFRLEILNIFGARDCALLSCTANYAAGRVDQSREGQGWSWEPRGKCQDCYVLPNCSPQSLYQFERLSSVWSCLGNHKWVMVLIDKYLWCSLSNPNSSKSRNVDVNKLILWSPNSESGYKPPLSS